MNTSHSRKPMLLGRGSYVWCLLFLVCAQIGALGQEPTASPDRELQKKIQQERLRNEVGDVQNAVALSPGQLIERDLSVAQKHIYKINVKAGQYLHVNVNQRGINVRLKLVSPGDIKVVTVDTPNGSYGPESLSFITETEGDIFLRVEPNYGSAPGHYDISLVALRVPTPEDRLRIEAEKALDDAKPPRWTTKPEDYKEALKKYDRALRLWEKIGDPYWQAFTLFSIASLHAALDEKLASFQAYTRALSLYRLARDPAGEYRALSSIGSYYFAIKDNQQALTYFNLALSIAVQLDDRLMGIRALQDVALTEWNLGQQQPAIDHFQQTLVSAREIEKTSYEKMFPYDRAIEFLNQALKIKQMDKDAAGEASLYFDLGWVSSLDGYDCGPAIAFYQSAFAANQNNSNQATRLALLEKLESVFGAAGEECDGKEAIEAYLRLLQIVRATNNRAEVANALEKLGNAYIDDGQRTKGIESLEKALAIWRSVGDHAREGSALDRLGDVYDSNDQEEKALAFWKEAVTAKRKTNDREGEIRILFKQGKTYSASGKYNDAVQCYEDLLRIKTERDGEIQIVSLINLGTAYLQLSRPDDAILRLESAVLRGQMGDRLALAIALNNLGELYRSTGKVEKAIDSYQTAIREGGRIRESRSFLYDLPDLIIGSGYDSIQRYVHARDIEKFLVVHFSARRKVRPPARGAVRPSPSPSPQPVSDSGRRLNTGVIFNNLGLAYYLIGKYELAILEYQRALAEQVRVKSSVVREVITNNLGLVYKTLAQYDKALQYYEQNLAEMLRANNKAGVALSLNNLGGVHEAKGSHQDALKYFRQALDVMREVKDRKGEGVVLNNLGSVYLSLKQDKDALEYFNRALAIRRQIKDRLGEADTLSNLGSAHLLLKDYKPAIALYEQALIIERETGDRLGQATALHNLMLTSRAVGGAVLAIFYGKQAVNIFQQLRANISGLGKDPQNSFLRSKEDTYRTLAELLINSGRLPEAEQVLALLKDEEFASMRRRDEPASSVGYSSVEAEAVKALGQLGELGREANGLRSLKEKKLLDEKGQQRLDLIEGTLLPQANAKFRLAIAAIEKEAPETVVKTAEVKEAQSLMRYLREMGPGTVALYTVVSTEEGKSSKGWVILVTPNFRKAYEMDVTDLDQTVAALRQTLRSDTYDPQPLARKLYGMIFLKPQKEGETLAADLGAYLRDQKEKTLMWSLDGVLRYVPMAALHDGEKYLLETYRNVVFTPASLPGLTHATSREWNALGLGVAKKYEGFNALSGVPKELSAIVRDETKHTTGVLPGTIKWDDEFKEKAMMDSLSEGYNVVHIASHFSYQAANPEKSFLLLGDGGHLEMSKIQDLTTLFEKTDLVTLSACDTAVGSAMKDANGKDVEGFAYVTQKLGAMAVIASLWPVDDVGTQVLMPKFYGLRQKGLSKGEALRQAQMSLLSGEVQPTASEENSQRAEVVDQAWPGGTAAQPVFKSDPKAPYAHPYYWAPFILIGNWK